LSRLRVAMHGNRRVPLGRVSPVRTMILQRLLVITVACALCVPSGITAQVSTPPPPVSVAQADSIAIEREVASLMQISMRGIFRAWQAPLVVALRYADGRERVHTARTMSALVNVGLPSALRARQGPDTLVVEIGQFTRRGELIVVDVRLVGPVRDGCLSYFASVGRHEGFWRRYVASGNPMGCDARRW